MQTNKGSGVKKYAPHLSELKTDVEQQARVREIVLEADTLEELFQDLERFGVTKPLYFLQCFARANQGAHDWRG